MSESGATLLGSLTIVSPNGHGTFVESTQDYGQTQSLREAPRLSNLGAPVCYSLASQRSTLL